MTSVIQSSGQASWSMSVIKHPPHAWDSGVDHLLHLPALLSPEYNSVFCLGGEVSDPIDAQRLPTSLMVIRSTSSPESKVFGKHQGAKAPFPHKQSLLYGLIPHHLPPPSCDDGMGEVPFCEFVPFCLQPYISPCYGRSVTCALFTCTMVVGSLEFTIGTKA